MVHWICSLVETFRFEDEDDYTSTRFDFKIFRVFSKISGESTLQKASLYHFSLEKDSIVMFSEEGYGLSRSQNDKTSEHLMSCFRHHDIRANIRKLKVIPLNCVAHLYCA